MQSNAVVRRCRVIGQGFVADKCPARHASDSPPLAGIREVKNLDPAAGKVLCNHRVLEAPELNRIQWRLSAPLLALSSAAARAYGGAIPSQICSSGEGVCVTPGNLRRPNCVGGLDYSKIVQVL